MTDFADKVVIVTGGAQGIGWACVYAFLKAGAKVICADMDDEKAKLAISRLEDNLQENVMFSKTDVSKSDDVRDMVGLAISEYGRLDVMIANAGVIHKAPFLELQEEDFDRVLSVNLKGVFLCGQEAAKAMLEQRKNGIEDGLDAIINMSSVNAILAIPEITPYIVSKGGVNQLTKVMAVSLSEHNIRVNAVGPGSINTEMLKVAMQDEAARKTVLSRTPLRRPGEPAEIANVAKFLASKESSYITGQTIYADGGRMGLNYVVPVPE